MNIVRAAGPPGNSQAVQDMLREMAQAALPAGRGGVPGASAAARAKARSKARSSAPSPTRKAPRKVKVADIADRRFRAGRM